MKAKEAEEKAIAAESKASAAEERASAAERENDRLDAYQRRETLVSSGQIIPVERIEESTSDIIVSLVNKYLTVKISKEDINISHRLGSTNSLTPDAPLLSNSLAVSLNMQFSAPALLW